MSNLEKKILLDDGVIENGVIGGKEGWLFLYEGVQRQFSYLSGAIKVEKKYVDNMDRNTLRRLEACGAIGARYLNVIMPAKPVCCERTLPSEFSGRISSLYLSYFQGDLSKESRDVTIYPVEELLGEENFKKLDTHLNDSGNFNATKALLHALGIEFYYHPDLKSLPNGGDLAKMIGQAESVSMEPTMIQSLVGLQDYDNKLLLRAGTNSGHMRLIESHENRTGRKLIICGDSFSVGLLPLFARCFDSVFYVRGPIFPYNALKSFSPTHVISSSTERYISAQVDDGMGQSSFSHYEDSYWYDPSNRVCAAFDGIFRNKIDGETGNRNDMSTKMPSAHHHKSSGKNNKMTQAATQVHKTIVIHKPAKLEKSLEKATIVICGSQRGKTSAVAYAAYNLGLFLGTRIGEKNYEDLDILKELPDPALKKNFAPRKLQNIIDERNEKHDVWGFKIPHASGYVKELSEMLRNPIFVIVFRNPVSVIRSICNRETTKFDIEIMLRIAARPIEAARLVNTTPAPAIFVDADELDRNPKIFVEELAKALKLTASSEVAAGLERSGYETSIEREGTTFVRQ